MSWKQGWVLGALVVVAACASGNEGTQSEAAPAPVTDPEIAAIVVAANGVDAEIGEFAAGRASSAAVQEFARTMVRDHKAVNEQAAALVAKLGVTPAENDVSRKLRADGAAFRTTLSAKSGGEFDRAYIEHEVAYHKAVIDAVDQLLVPSAQNAELKQTLVAVRPALVAHLEHAQHIQTSLK